MLTQQPGMSIEHRAVLGADAVLADPANGAHHLEVMGLAIATDYRRAFARALVARGLPPHEVWAAMGSVPVGTTVRLAADLVAPLSPRIAPGG